MKDLELILKRLHKANPAFARTLTDYIFEATHPHHLAVVRRGYSNRATGYLSAMHDGGVISSAELLDATDVLDRINQDITQARLREVPA
ncbi:hypothetical protein ACLD0W_12755 [Alloalcanivorax sp. C16-1]|uniref:hypothetical protein n=1 Tax=Alloalcanivorax sp. C16-1 TaxID=3390051 RepID=UPI003970F9E4